MTKNSSSNRAVVPEAKGALDRFKFEVANGAVKKNRRGISNKTVAAARLKFHEKDASPANGLFMAHLVL